MLNEPIDKVFPDDKTKQTRRGFLVTLFAFLSLFVTGFTYTVLRYLWPQKGKKSGSQIIQLIIPVSDIDVGSSLIQRFNGKPVVVIRTESTEIFALSAACTHLGCIVKWHSDKKQLICPCHAATFDQFGNVLGGPAPKPLPSFPAKVAGDKIVVG